MNSRLDYDQDSTVLTQIRNLQSDVAELKSRQSIGRELVTRTYSVQTVNAWDYSAYAIAPNTVMSFYFTATGDGTQDRPYGSQYSGVYNNGTDSAHRLSDYQVNDATGTNYAWRNLVPGTTTNIMQWIITVRAGSSGASIYIKFRAVLSCKAVRLTSFVV
jgi:hypothetical protein